MLGLLALLACAPRGAADTASAPAGDTPAPALTSVAIDCDDSRAEWTFDATTDAWTGNGQVVLSSDGAYVERHTMYSVEAAADGSADHLALDLDVVPDWRDVSEGSSTFFNCGAAGVAGVLRVFTRDGGGVADCVAFGDTPDRWAEWDEGVYCAQVQDTGAR